MHMESSSSSSSLWSSSSSPSSDGPLFELFELMAQLPTKRRGLSKYYDGKSQSFACLGNVSSVEDLVKKESCYSKRMRTCKSNLNQHKFGPKATIAKRSPKSQF